MIVFDLRCDAGHVFEAWFASSAAWDQQRGAGHVACPICGDTRVEKAVMAPAVAAKGNRAAAMTPAALKQAVAMLASEQARMLNGSEWVGTSFAQRARAMHDGEEAHATIHGQASLAEAKALIDDGVPVAPLPLPVTPPDQVH
ncbi:DUF1178 family protein [Sphingomonas sp. KR1UV-12]|uniref:DUF1178 family protein n=1 Tax=Sphingomonas aurea TaxID=3063994 RepID=A0ABT9EGF8_9SPHN|nr:DUF1178 family protein [Sphingomonas sp. KR1UV-12]MDP1025927.1 DUF1178 family protein [Sphingomonas sp. KR1UV-12]